MVMTAMAIPDEEKDFCGLCEEPEAGLMINGSLLIVNNDSIIINNE